MKKKLLSFLSSLLTASLLLGALAACQPAEEETGGTTESVTESKTEGDTTTATDATDSTESDVTEGDSTSTETSTDTATESETESETEDATSPELKGVYGPVIKNAYDLSNKISNYFTDADRKHARVENANMVFDYTLTDTEDILATLKNKKGGVYVKDTMDVYVKMNTGKTYYSSKSISPARSNSFRYGYYYYDVRVLDHSFINSDKVVDELALDLRSFDKGHEMTKPKTNKSLLKTQIEATVDPYITGTFDFSADKYNAISISLKTTSTSSVDVFYKIGDQIHYDYEQSVKIDTVADGEFHTYRIIFNKDDLPTYTGQVTGLRVDFNGEAGETIEINELKALKIDFDNAPHLFFDRTLHTFPEKLNQVVHIVAGSEVTGIEEIGMITKIEKSTVEKLIVKDKNGEKTTLDGVDWASVEYVGFDIKDVGIFGYILLPDKTSGTLKVTLDGDNYVINQSRTPEDGKIIAPAGDTSNDFYMGHRLYTDENHDFDAFILEATIERNPLSAENFSVDAEKSPKSSYSGYDALRGMYKFTLPPNISFQDSYDNRFNEHNNVVFTVKGDEYNRNVYVLAYAFTTDIECAAILDDKEMMLPIALEVCKNFLHEHEEPIFDNGDVRYSEAIFPVSLAKDDEYTFKVIHLYQNWGRKPLKQISAIQFFAPYYHLSTGTSETNCISNQYVHGKDLFTLPDHRAMSAPMWEGQPQHSSGGYHYFLQYTDAEGKYYASENTVNTITAAGPTYAEIEMVNMSDDGKIKVTYTHMEMPQLDENRTYYTMKYEILEDISFNNFLKDFSFYTMKAFHSTYAYLGYLNDKNECVVTDTNQESTAKTYVLGDNKPYFNYHKVIAGSYVNDYVNLSCIINNSRFVIGGKEVTPQFAIVDHNNAVRLSLNYEKLDLVAGDEMYISMIIMPWGSHESIYDGSNGKASDQNVRDVRENSLLNPAKATALSRCEVVENEFIPMIRTEDGKIATFSVSGGQDNIAVRVYGFTTLTVPKIYERVGDEWVQYKISSAATPDKLGNAHPYDGYCVHYDGDGTYSYSFIVTMDGGKERNLRIIADSEFTGWTDEDRFPDIENADGEEAESEPFDFCFTPEEIKDSTTSSIGDKKVMKEDDLKFVRFFGNGKGAEGYVNLTPIGEDPTGQYVIIKYRMPTTNPENANKNLLFDIFTSTEALEATDKNGSYAYCVVPNGEWQVVVFDITKFATNKEFKADENGKYSVNFIRFDMFNGVFSTESYIDIAYVAMSDDIAEICTVNSDVEEITLVNGIDKNMHSKISTADYDQNKPLYDFYCNPSTIADAVASGRGEVKILDDEGKKFIRIFGDGKSAETCLTMRPGANTVTGQYVVIKYRVPTSNKETADTMWMDVFTSTSNENPVGLIDFAQTYGIIADDQWHLLVLDLTKFTETCKVFEADENNQYKAKFIRFDVFNQITSVDSYIDVAYIGMCDSLEKICETNADLSELTLSEGIRSDKHTVIDIATGKAKE